MMEDLIQIMRREAMNCIGLHQRTGSMAVTSYDPKTHAVKGVLLPSMVETGWVPLPCISAGDGYGVMVGPTAGTADKLDGDIFDVDFVNGDQNTPVLKQKHFSVADNPPWVEAGEMLIKHQTGGSTHFRKDGSIATTHKDGGSYTFDKDGHVSIDTKDKNVTINSGTGSQTFAAKSQSFTAENIAIKGKVALDGDLSSTGKLNGGGGVLSSNLPVRTA